MDVGCTAKSCPLQKLKGRMKIGTLNGPYYNFDL